MTPHDKHVIRAEIKELRAKLRVDASAAREDRKANRIWIAGQKALVRDCERQLKHARRDLRNMGRAITKLNARQGRAAQAMRDRICVLLARLSARG